eukprot:8484692-Heterocapsa_arctica.AAC.1
MGPPTDEEIAPTPMACDPNAEILPAEAICGNLWDCVIDTAARDAVMSDMLVAKDGEVGIN